MQPTRLLYPWDSPGKNTGVGFHALLQEIFSTQWSNPGFPHCKCIIHFLSHEGSPQFCLPFQKKKKILWGLGSGFFPLTMDHIVALDCIPNSCCTLHYQAALRSCASEANNASSDKEYPPIISCVMTLFASSVTSSSCCLHEKFLPLCRPIPIFEVLTKVHPCSYGKMHLPTTGHCSEVIHGPLQLSSKKSWL